MTEQTLVALFQCAICKTGFVPVGGGGLCYECSAIVCRRHLEMRIKPPGYLCSTCADKREQK